MAAAGRVASSSSLPRVSIAIEGACISSEGAGGWAALLDDGSDVRVLDGTHALTTARAMQLTAIVTALAALDTPSHVTLHIPSRRLFDDITFHLQGRPTRNAGTCDGELWNDLRREISRHEIAWAWCMTYRVPPCHDGVVATGSPGRIDGRGETKTERSCA